MIIDFYVLERDPTEKNHQYIRLTQLNNSPLATAVSTIGHVIQEKLWKGLQGLTKSSIRIISLAHQGTHKLKRLLAFHWNDKSMDFPQFKCVLAYNDATYLHIGWTFCLSLAAQY